MRLLRRTMAMMLVRPYVCRSVRLSVRLGRVCIVIIRCILARI